MPHEEMQVEFSRRLNGHDAHLQPCGNEVTIATGEQIIAVDEWNVATLSDETINDSDKNFTVPAGQQWQILWVYVKYASDATAGNRQLQIEMRDALGNLTAQLARAGAVQAASLTYYYMFAPSLNDLTAFRDTDFLTIPLPPTVFLNAGETIRVWDNNTISGNDDMSLYVSYAYRSV